MVSRRAGPALVVGLLSALAAARARAERPYPILFVTQTPNPGDFTSVVATFGTHRGTVDSAPRGGDLYLLYPNGNLKNLTAAAGYGAPGGAYPAGFQGASAIAVREPAVHWSGTKAIFSMLVGAPSAQYQWADFCWQLYEVTGLGESDTPAITQVPNQPAAYNNVSPVYLADDSILFTSDRPRNGQAHLHPQRDEYESAPTVSGIWRLDPATGALELLDHSPSGDFKPIVDSFGRVVFTRWDHLQRDQQADADCSSEAAGQGTIYGTFDAASELPGAARVARSEVFPEARTTSGGCAPVAPPFNRHTMNLFLPWMTNQDGSELETLNHVGRHELAGYFEPSRLDDPNLEYFACGGNACGRANPVEIQSMHQIRESKTEPGLYLGTEAPEFGTHASGQLISLPGAPGLPADEMAVAALTHPLTRSPDGDGLTAPEPCHSGLYRSPLPLSDGSLVAVHAGERSPGVPETRADANVGTSSQPASRYAFRLRELVPASGDCTGYRKYGPLLTSAIVKSLWYWSPDQEVRFTNVTMWELDPVEVRARPVPPPQEAPLPAPETAVFEEEGVEVESFRDYLEANGLALAIARDVTTRDSADRQQPFHLTVPGGTAETTGAPGTIYPVAYLQFFQGDLVRGLGGQHDPPAPGRRVLARPLHDPAVANPPLDPGDPPGSVEIASDGSMAALLPAHRALSWQTTDGAGQPIVRERCWLTLRSGEIRVCTSCHGLNSADQAGQGAPQNEPEALRLLLQWWKGFVFRDGFESGDASRWSP
jgi:hypothetical protein